MANSDGRDDVAVSMAELWSRYHSWVRDRYSEAEVRRLFAETAEEAVVVWQVSREDQALMEEKLQKLHQEVHLPFVRDRQVAVVQ